MSNPHRPGLFAFVFGRRPHYDPNRVIFAELEQISWRLTRIMHRQTRQMEILMGNQADLDRIAAGLTQLDSDLNADTSSLQAQLADLRNQGVDTSGLESAFSRLGQDVANLSAVAGNTPSIPADPGSGDNGSDPSTGDNGGDPGNGSDPSNGDNGSV